MLSKKETISVCQNTLGPFGIEITSATSMAPGDLDIFTINRLVKKHQFVVIRNVCQLSDADLLAFAESFKLAGRQGILAWGEQKMFALKVEPEKKNYIFSSERVHLHWDGAFFQEPSLLVFHCMETPSAGGETFFTNTRDLAKDLLLEEGLTLTKLELTIATEKLAHYGGSRTLPVLQRHPDTNEPIMRIAESVTTELNPVHVHYDAHDHRASHDIENYLVQRCYDPRYYLEHVWHPGDLVIADNHALLHGRKEFSPLERRHIRRVQVL